MQNISEQTTFAQRIEMTSVWRIGPQQRKGTIQAEKDYLPKVLASNKHWKQSTYPLERKDIVDWCQDCIDAGSEQPLTTLF